MKRAFMLAWRVFRFALRNRDHKLLVELKGTKPGEFGYKGQFIGDFSVLIDLKPPS